MVKFPANNFFNLSEKAALKAAFSFAAGLIPSRRSHIKNKKKGA